GGGAFLHPARITRRGTKAPLAEYPGAKTSLALALRIPWVMAFGRSGFLVHVFFALVYLPTYGIDFYVQSAPVSPSAVTAILAAVVSLLVGGWRRHAAIKIGALATATGVAIGFLPLAIEALSATVLGRMGLSAMSSWSLTLQYVVAIYGAVFIAGVF